MIGLDAGLSTVLAALIAGGTGVTGILLSVRPARRAARESENTRQHVENGARAMRSTLKDMDRRLGELGDWTKRHDAKHDFLEATGGMMGER